MSISPKPERKPKSAAKKSKRPASAKRTKRTRSPKRRTKDANHDEVDVKLPHGFEGRLVEGKFEGVKISSDDDAYVMVEIINNGRGNQVRERRVVKYGKNQVRHLGVQDMLLAVDNDGEEEDERAVEFDRSTWECTECGGFNTNDGSNCTNLVNGRVCRNVRVTEIRSEGWAGCFVANTEPKWTCGTCSIKNTMDISKCLSCGNVRSNAD